MPLSDEDSVASSKLDPAPSHKPRDVCDYDNAEFARWAKGTQSHGMCMFLAVNPAAGRDVILQKLSDKRGVSDIPAAAAATPDEIGAPKQHARCKTRGELMYEAAVAAAKAKLVTKQRKASSTRTTQLTSL